MSLLFLFYSIVALGTIEVQAQTFLKMNHQLPATAVGAKIDQWFADEVYRLTDGEIKIQIFWSNGLGEPRKNLTLLKKGDIDMAAMSPGYFPSELPHFAAPNSIPMGMDDICQASEIMKAFLDEIPAFDQEAAAQGIQPLFFHVLSPYLLVSKEPITTLAQLEGKRIRTWGNDLPLLISSVNAKPIRLFLPDIHGALKHNVIDACPFSPDLVVTYKIYEVAQHISEIVIWEGPAYGVWISQKKFDTLSQEHRNILLEVAERARLKELPELIAAENKARQFLQAEGITFHAFSSEELLKWKAEAPDFFSEFISKMDALGKGESARKMVELWRKMRKDISCQ